MGYGLVVVLDETTEADPAELGRSLLDAVGTDTYPTSVPPRQVGPWTVAGAFHPHRAVTIAAGAGTAVANAKADGFARQARFVPRRGAGDWSRAERELLRHPDRYANAMMRVRAGEPMAAVLFGDHVTNPTASVWWVYADSLGSLSREDPETLGHRLVELRAGTDTGISSGSFSSAVNLAGVVDGPGEVTVVWSANRVCAPEDLTAPEQDRLTRS